MRAAPLGRLNRAGAKEGNGMRKGDERKMSNEGLLDTFEWVVTEWTKAANGMNHKSERKLNREYDALKAEILRRMQLSQ